MDQTHRVFEYTDFFARDATVHSGDVIDFHEAPGTAHTISLAADETTARSVYPPGSYDTEDPIKALGSGQPKIVDRAGQQSITGGSTQGGGKIGSPTDQGPPCGLVAVGMAPCTFSGGNDIESSGILPAINFQTGQPQAQDWDIRINAAPGTYTFFCFIHPGMHGTLHVVPQSQPSTIQALLDIVSEAQFQADRAEALAAEAAANQPTFTGGAPGTRTYQVQVGIGTPDRHVAIDEMLPNKPLNLVAGDQVNYVWNDPHNVHTVTFTSDPAKAPSSDGFDCGSTYQSAPQGPPGPGQPAFTPCVDPVEKAPEAITDPGNAPSGTALSDPAAIVDSGFLPGTGYGLTTTTPMWTIVTSGSTKAGSYSYMCTVHDWMQGTINVGTAPTS